MLLSMVVNLSCFPGRKDEMEGRKGGKEDTSRGNGLVC